MLFYFYILISEKTGGYYYGSSSNPEHRLLQHNQGLSQYTKKDRPWKIIHTESFSNLSEARKREFQIKSWHSRKAVQRLINTSGKIADPRSATAG